MAETFASPSELHLKKFSGNCSSWRSPLAFDSASRIEDRSKKAYLYNWVDPSEGKREGKNSEYAARKKVPTKPIPECASKNTRKSSPGRKSVRKLKKTSLLKRKNLRVSARTKLLNPPCSSPPRAHDSADDDNDDGHDDHDDVMRCYSSSKMLIQKCGRDFSPVSPLISSKILRATGKDESSSYSATPVSSTSSFDRYLRRKNQTVSNVKYRRSGGWCSPSFSDTLRRRGSSILCGGQNLAQKKNFSGLRGPKKELARVSVEQPLLANDDLDDGSLLDSSSDEASSNFEELEWSNSDKVLDQVIPGHLSLCQKYSPVSFDEIIGQNIVVQSLRNAVIKMRIAPAYLFHGPRGTGKSSVARIFASALNCQATASEKKPCGCCRECLEFVSGRRSRNIREFDAVGNQRFSEIRKFLKKVQSHHRVIIIDECNAMQAEVWPVLIRLLEEPPPRVVFVLITVEPESLPRAVLSRCQKYPFMKVKDSDMVRRLEIISSKEHLDVELGTLHLIAQGSNGSLRDAEGILDQLSLIGKRITPTLVFDLVGLVSNEKLVVLLETALSGNAVETVKRCREVLDSGIDQVSLMSQLAGVIMDAIVGESSTDKTAFCGLMSLSAGGVIRLREALRILSEAEKQLRMSDERSTWFTAAILQLGSWACPEVDRCTRSGHSLPRKTNALHEELEDNEKHPSLLGLARRSVDVYADNDGSERRRRRQPGKKLDELWRMCIENCHSKTLRQLLADHGQLISISETEGVALVSLMFDDETSRSRARGYLISITDAMETVIGQEVKVKIQLPVDAAPRLAVAGRRWSKDDSEVSGGQRSTAYYLARRSADGGETSLSQGRRTMLEGSGFPSSSVHCSWMKQKSEIEDQSRDAGENAKAALRWPVASKHWDDDMNQTIKALKSYSHPLRQPPGAELVPDRDSWFRESARGCGGCFCWKQIESGGDKEEPAMVTTSPQQPVPVLRRRSVLRIGPCMGAERATSS